MRLKTFFAKRALAVILALGIAAGPSFAVMDDPPPPKPADDKKDTKDEKKRTEDHFQSQFWRAHALIRNGDYAGGRSLLLTLDRPHDPEVANLVGFASRKLGAYADAKVWYERALATDPQHVRTWSYYGMWHAESGNILMAKDYLQKVGDLCGNQNCKEFRELQAVINGVGTY